MSYTFVINDSNISLYNIADGNKVVIFSDDIRYKKFKELILLGDYELAESLDVKKIVAKFSETYKVNDYFSIEITDGLGTVNLGDPTSPSFIQRPLADTIVKRIIRMVQEGFNPAPLVAFLNNLYSNPSKTAVDELFLFLEYSDLPITIDGCFIAYKIVKDDYKDIYTGTIDNSVGTKVDMPRFAVDDCRNNLCSAGLHFCSKGYLAAYGSANQEIDRCVLIKINPADVVSIPADYNNAKGRTCAYEVVGEVGLDDWRELLSVRDYNSESVVDVDGDDYSDDKFLV